MQLLKNVPLSEYSTMRVGGPARFFVVISNAQEAQEALTFAHQERLPFFVLGKGSNLIFPDEGLDGLVILNKIDFLKIDGPCIDVGGGFSFSRLGSLTARQGLAGLEFASGIPGSVGGAIVMNAGANGAETQDTLQSVQFVDAAERKMVELSKKTLQMGYRSSIFQTEKKGIVTAAKFQLNPENRARERQLEIIDKRKKTQPLKEASAGCVFRNPAHCSAGQLIDQCGLKGKKVGDAMVSEIHANFIVNCGQAKAQDVLQLIQDIKSTVKEKTGHMLECEVKLVSS